MPPVPRVWQKELDPVKEEAKRYRDERAPLLLGPLQVRQPTPTDKTSYKRQLQQQSAIGKARTEQEELRAGARRKAEELARQKAILAKIGASNDTEVNLDAFNFSKAPEMGGNLGKSTVTGGSLAGAVSPLGGKVRVNSAWTGPGTHRQGQNRGIDLQARVGTPIYATQSGTVGTASGGQGNYGTSILLNHGGSTQSRYSHLSGMVVKAGQQVAKGQLIGYTGATGNVTGPHLDFEIIIGGRAVNPAKYYGW